MKTTFNISMLALAAATLVATATTSCNKKDGPAPAVETPDEPKTKLPAPTVAEFAKLREEAIGKMTTKKTIDIDDPDHGGSFADTSGQGRIFMCPTVCLTSQDGNQITGNIEANFTEIYDRGGMVLANTDGKIVPLVTGGQFVLEVKQGNEVLKNLCSYFVDIPGTITGGYSAVSGGWDDVNQTLVPVSATDDKMKSWKGGVGSGGNPIWEFMDWNNPDISINEGAVHKKQGEDVYAGTIGSPLGLGKWINVGRYYVPSGQTTQLKVNVPDGYNAQNANVYLAYEGEKYLLAQLYNYDATGKFFTEPEGFVPVGKKVHAIFVSESEGKFAYGIKETTVTANATVTFEHKDLAKIDPDKLAEKVNDLK